KTISRVRADPRAPGATVYGWDASWRRKDRQLIERQCANRATELFTSGLLFCRRDFKKPEPLMVAGSFAETRTVTQASAGSLPIRRSQSARAAAMKRRYCKSNI